VYALLVAGFEHLEVYDACLKGRLRAR
jgi:hypothetical protein